MHQITTNPVCKRLLQESKFTKCRNTSNNTHRDVSLDRDNGCTFYDRKHRLIIAELYFDGDSLCELKILDVPHELLKKFMEFYDVEPYTYTFVPDSELKRDEYSPLIKPFTYDTTYYEPIYHDKAPLPVCIKYEGIYNIESIVNYECGDEIVYNIAKKMQNKEAITVIKSAQYKSN